MGEEEPLIVELNAGYLKVRKTPRALYWDRGRPARFSGMPRRQRYQIQGTWSELVA